ncbi:uncharacterized protein LOC116136740 isoform X2 [Pistacia vera]|nr:uncharacterized protein LOC116136740 isoform X2 [Pistacia vera]
MSKVSRKKSTRQVDILSFIQSTFSKLQGPHHCWFNIVERNKEFFKRDGAFLVLAGPFLDNCSSQVAGSVDSFEKIKLIQQRFPLLHVMGFLPGCSISSTADQTRLVELVMKEYITFPVLLSNKNFPEMENGACYIIFKNFRNARVYHEKGLDIEMLKKAVEELNVLPNGNSSSPTNLKSTWVKQVEVLKEPYLCSSLRNLLLHFPGCISADESSDRLFLSDSNHHRIIITDGNGKILDCIGSCPGFEDGEFEFAKLARPGASFYNEDEDCLYIVDSENHAIRRADMERRVVETLHPTFSINKKNNSLWSWIENKLGFRRDEDTKSEEFGSQSLMFPWHLMKSEDDSMLIINRSFESLWIMDLASGEIKEVVTGSKLVTKMLSFIPYNKCQFIISKHCFVNILSGFSKILEICGELIMEKVHFVKQMPHDLLQQQIDSSCSTKELPYAGLISSLTAIQNHIIMCDMVGQRMLKLSKESGVLSNFQFSNFGILGLPYWLSFPLERVYSVAGGLQGAWTHQLQHLGLLPGRVDIKLNVDIPLDTELVEPLQEGCIWLQARGAATEVSRAEGILESSEKVGVSQQWYDELDNLAFSTAESELTIEDDDATSDLKSDDERVHIDCAVNTSPGISEVIICAAFYLKLRRDPDQQDSQEKYAARITDILNPERIGGMRRDLCIHLLLKSNRDLRDLVFMKPLHVRIKLDCIDHPKAVHNSKEIILTDSKIDFTVSLHT